MSQEVLQFNKVMFDDSLHDYINGNLIIKMKINKCDNQVNNINNVTKSVIIDFYLDKYNIEKTDENILKYSKIYDSLLNSNNKEIVDKIKPRYYNKKKYTDDDDEYNEDHRLHYQQYFGRYKDLLYIIDYYEKLIEEYENKEYESFEENNEYISDNESYISDYDYEDDINNYEEDYDEEEYYDDEY